MPMPIPMDSNVSNANGLGRHGAGKRGKFLGYNNFVLNIGLIEFLGKQLPLREPGMVVMTAFTDKLSICCPWQPACRLRP